MLQCLEKEVRDYKSPEMISKFTSQNGRVLSLKIQTNQSEKNIFIFKMKNNLINLKLDPQTIELNESIKT